MGAEIPAVMARSNEEGMGMPETLPAPHGTVPTMNEMHEAEVGRESASCISFNSREAGAQVGRKSASFVSFIVESEIVGPAAGSRKGPASVLEKERNERSRARPGSAVCEKE
jgi:hypothetical protein